MESWLKNLTPRKHGFIRIIIGCAIIATLILVALRFANASEAELIAWLQEVPECTYQVPLAENQDLSKIQLESQSAIEKCLSESGIKSTDDATLIVTVVSPKRFVVLVAKFIGLSMNMGIAVGTDTLVIEKNGILSDVSDNYILSLLGEGNRKIKKKI